MNNQVKEKFRFRLHGKTLVVIDWANVYGWHKNLKWNVGMSELFLYLKSYTEVFEQRFYHGVDPKKDWSGKIKEDAENMGFMVVSKEVKWTPVYLNRQNHFKGVIEELFGVLDGMKITNSKIATKLYDLRKKIEVRLSGGEYPSYTSEDEKVYNSVYDLIEELDNELKKLNINIGDLQEHLQEPVMRMKCDFDVEITRDVLNSINSFEQLILFSGDGDYSALVDDLILKDKKAIVVFASGHKGKEYKNQTGLFLCTVENLRDDICKQTNIPTDFSVGRDINTLSDTDGASQSLVDKLASDHVSL